MKEETPLNDTITFRGTPSTRIMVGNQFLSLGGLWLNLSGTEIILETNPGSIVQSTKRKLRAEKLSTIILSYRHLDHSTDINIMVESMTQGGFNPHGWFFTPDDDLKSEPVIFSYPRDFPESVEILKGGKDYSIGNISFATLFRYIHQVETYSKLFNTEKHTFSYIANSRYFDGLCRSYHGKLLIIDMVRVEVNHPFNHLSIPDAEHIIMELKPEIAILTYFARTVWQAKPREVA